MRALPSCILEPVWEQVQALRRRCCDAPRDQPPRRGAKHRGAAADPWSCLRRRSRANAGRQGRVRRRRRSQREHRATARACMASDV